jgi:hypothetical protein
VSYDATLCGKVRKVWERHASSVLIINAITTLKRGDSKYLRNIFLFLSKLISVTMKIKEENLNRNAGTSLSDGTAAALKMEAARFTDSLSIIY